MKKRYAAQAIFTRRCTRCGRIFTPPARVTENVARPGKYWKVCPDCRKVRGGHVHAAKSR